MHQIFLFNKKRRSFNSWPVWNSTFCIHQLWECGLHFKHSLHWCDFWIFIQFEYVKGEKDCKKVQNNDATNAALKCGIDTRMFAWGATSSKNENFHFKNLSRKDKHKHKAHETNYKKSPVYKKNTSKLLSVTSYAFPRPYGYGSFTQQQFQSLCSYHFQTVFCLLFGKISMSLFFNCL